LRSWRLIISALSAHWPAAQFCFVGKLQQDGRTSTSIGPEELAGLFAAAPRACDAFDRPLTEQLALCAECDVLISPHSGFGMAALAAGTPWLSIAGNLWPEYYFNGVPFYSVLPEPHRFPAYQGFGPEPDPVEDDGPRSPSMCFERIEADIDEIVDATSRLIEGRWPYETAMTDYFRRLLAVRGGQTDEIWSIDGVHLKYLAATT
jgi:hypothetical protein